MVEVEVEVQIGRTSDAAAGRFAVQVLRSPLGEAMETVELDVEGLLGRLWQVQEAVFASSMTRQRTAPETEETLQQVGRALFAALLGVGEVAGRYRAAAAEAADDGVHVVIRIDDPSLAGLPWEAMFDPSTETYVCRDAQLVRHVPVPRAPAALSVKGPLRILGIVASPRDLPPVDVELEKDYLTVAVAPLSDVRRVELQWVREPTWEHLQERLLDDEWHIVHFIGHGKFDPLQNTGSLALVAGDGGMHLVESDQLVNLLRQAWPMPRLVVLNSCHRAATGQPDLLSGTAASLVGAGVSAAIAMQFKMGQDDTIAFYRAFYSALSSGRDVDYAVSRGRAAILRLSGQRIEWLGPVLYLLGDQRRLFGLTGEDYTLLEPSGPQSEPPGQLAPSSGLGEPAARDDIQFSLVRPQYLVAGAWADLVVYAHQSQPYLEAGRGLVDPVEEVDRRASRLFGGTPTRTSRVDAQWPLPVGADLRFELDLPGVVCNPPNAQLSWWEPIHEVRFRVRPADRLAGTAIHGQVRVWMGPLLLAETAVNLPVVAAADDAAMESAVLRAPEPLKRYRKIFPSYSHADTDVVDRIRAAVSTLGDRYLQDVVVLRSGEVWEKRLLTLIEEADVFQLFWSTNSMRSRYCRREWEHALSLGRPMFIRPVYWERPLPQDESQDLPPEALRALHFMRMDSWENFTATNAQVSTSIDTEQDVQWAQPVSSGVAPERIPNQAQPAHMAPVINPPPATAPTWFQDRVIETGLLARDMADPGIRMVTVVGRGGIGKTAMVCRLLKGLEAGQVRDIGEDFAGLRAAGIVNLSPDGVHGISYATLVTDLIQLLPDEHARPLERLAKDGGTTPTALMRAVLDAFPPQDLSGREVGPVVVLLDKLESVMDSETESLTEPALEEALTTLLTAPAHAVKVIATTRIPPTRLLQIEPARQKCRPLEEGLGPVHAEAVLRALDDDGRVGLRDTSDTVLAGLREQTRGFPRALETVKSILDGDPSLNPDDLLDGARDLPEDPVVRVLIGEAYHLLDSAAQQVMQALAVFPTPVSAVGVDYLLQPVNPTTNAAPILTRLARRHLTRVQQGRHYLHPVDRAYALSQLPASQPDGTAPGSTLAGLRARAADYYAQIRTPRESWRSLDDISAQLAEFDLRCDGADDETAANVLFDITDYLQRWGHVREALALHQRLDGHLTDPWSQGANHTNLANCYLDLGQTSTAMDHYQQALTIDREIGNRQGEAGALTGLANCYSELGQTSTAIDHYQQALTICREIGNRAGEATASRNLGDCYSELGQTSTAIDHYQQALTIDREIGYRYGEGMDLINLGDASVDEQAWARTAEFYREAIGIGDQTGNAQVRSEARIGLARCSLLTGDPGGSLTWAAAAAQVDYEPNRSIGSLLIGIAQLRQGHTGHAKAAFTQAITQADADLEKTPDKYEALDIRGLALSGLVAAGQPAALRDAVDAFHRARRINTAAGIVTRTLRDLDQIISTGHGHDLDAARGAATGAGPSLN